MKIPFCGHSTYIKTLEDEKKILEILENTVKNMQSDFLLGQYGNFDHFAYTCAKKFKESHPTVFIFLYYINLSIDSI